MRAPALLLMLLGAPLVAAGSASQPEATDPAHDAVPDLGWNDMLAAWFTYEAGALRIHWQVSEYAHAVPLACWNLDLRVNTQAYDAFVRDEGTGIFMTNRPTGQNQLSYVVPVTVEPGSPATFHATPNKRFMPVAPGDVVKFRLIQSCEYIYSIPPYDRVANGATFTAG